MRYLAPSLLAADLAKIGEQVDLIQDAGAKYLHIDVMDGHFVPNISFGIPVVESLYAYTDIILDVHLMIENPSDFIDDFVAAGADIITFHVENGNIQQIIDKIKDHGIKVGLAINPSTRIEEIMLYLPMVDMALIMSVEPGFGGQEFMPNMLDRAAEIRAYCNKNNIAIDIQMDGGITLENVKQVIDNGVNVVVAGSSIFGSDDITQATKDFCEILEI